MSGTKPRLRKLRGGALVVVSALLLGSAILRLGVQAGTPMAVGLPGADEHNSSMEKSPGRANQTPADLQVLIDALQSRERKISQKETQIEDRMKALEIAEQAIDMKLVALIEAEEKLSATLTLADGASEDDLARLTDVYQKMKPKDAAALFEEMAPEFAAGFLGRMRPESAASIMAGLEPKTAYTVSVLLAGRNAWVPKK
jgi:flagellar motility protein MotE (MotC chaperone)